MQSQKKAYLCGLLHFIKDYKKSFFTFNSRRLHHIKEQSLIQKQPSKLEGCFCIYARKAWYYGISGLFLFSGDLVEQAAISPLPIAAIT